MNLELARAASALVERGESFAWVSILTTHGSSPRHTGATMLVRSDGSITGTIGGGSLEATTIAEALAVLRAKEPRLLGFESPELGMLCGGGGLLLVDYVDAARRESEQFFRDLLVLLRSGRRGWMVTVVPREQSTPRVTRRLVASDGSINGDAVCNPELLVALAKPGDACDRLVSEDPNTYVQQIGARGAAYVFGAGHCGEKLAPVLSLVGFSVVVVDDRADFANEARFPTADRVVVPESFAGVVQTLPVDEQSYIVIVTRGHTHDKDVLAQSLRTPAGYIGMIGSKTKVARVFDALREEGFSADDLKRVHAPIGVAIGAETPEEIAVSIAAQLIQVRASRED